MELLSNTEYKSWLIEIKSKIRTVQIKAALAANKELINFYFELGKMIVEQQAKAAWGDKLIQQLSHDLAAEFSDMKGFSVTNLKYCKQFFSFYSRHTGQQPVDQLPWGHNILIFTKSKTLDEARFYIQQTHINNWSRDVLAMQLKSGLYKRQGKAITNFLLTLPQTDAELAQQTIKDPYLFDFVSMRKPYAERVKKFRKVCWFLWNSPTQFI